MTGSGFNAVVAVDLVLGDDFTIEAAVPARFDGGGGGREFDERSETVPGPGDLRLDFSLQLAKVSGRGAPVSRAESARLAMTGIAPSSNP